MICNFIDLQREFYCSLNKAQDEKEIDAGRHDWLAGRNCLDVPDRMHYTGGKENRCIICLNAPTHGELVTRGKYLVTIGACHDCHTPKKFGPNGPVLDEERFIIRPPRRQQAAADRRQSITTRQLDVVCRRHHRSRRPRGASAIRPTLRPIPLPASAPGARRLCEDLAHRQAPGPGRRAPHYATHALGNGRENDR